MLPLFRINGPRAARSAAGLVVLFLGACTPAAAASPDIRPAAQITSQAPDKPLETLTSSEAAPLQTAVQPTGEAAPTPTRVITATPAPANLYFSQPGDTFESLAGRFGVFPLDLRCLDMAAPYCPQTDQGAETDIGFDPLVLLPAGTPILFPETAAGFSSATRLIPDSEVVFSSAATDFDTAAYLAAAGGFLAGHEQYLMMNAWNSSAEIVDLVAAENSTNPRLLLALLEFQCGCVRSDAGDPGPYMGADFYIRHDLYGQLIWAVFELSNGYYGWRAGSLTEVILTDGAVVRLDPRLNAGTAALYNLFSKLYDEPAFKQALDPEKGFPALFREMFGDLWSREQRLYPDGVAQPILELPFEKGLVWSYTGGPHPAFEGNGPLAALDFAPASAEPGCQPTPAWVTAVADGPVVRSEFGLVVQDLDGDGDEHTGWVIMYLHIAEEGRALVGTQLETGEPLGQPSCEGGRTNGTHVHIARKLNGEWIPAGSGPLPFVLDGWTAVAGTEAYKGYLVRGAVKLEACTCSWRLGWIEND